MSETIYSTKNGFFLEIDGVDYLIREPIGWNNVELSIQRTPNHGFKISFPNKDIKLKASNNPHPYSGHRSKNLIDAAYLNEGQDARVYIKLCNVDKHYNITKTHTKQLIDFAQGFVRRLHETEFQCKQERDESQIEAYKDAPISVSHTRTVTNEPISQALLTPTLVTMHSKKIYRQFKATKGDDIRYNLPTEDAKTNMTKYYKIGFTHTEINEMGGNAFLSGKGYSAAPLIPDKLYVIKAENESGTYDIDLHIDMEFGVGHKVEGIGTNDIQDWFFRVKMQKSTEQNATELYSKQIVQNFTDLHISSVESNYLGTNVWVYFTEVVQDIIVNNVQLNLGEELYLWIENYVDFDNDNAQTIWTHKQNLGMTLDITGETEYPETQAEAYRLFELGNYILDAILGENNKLKSNFMQSGGGRKYVVMNGWSIRQLSAGHPLTLSLEDLLDSAVATWGLGWGFEDDGSGNTVLRVELMEHFYQNHKVLDVLIGASDYKEETDPQMSVNQVSVKYPRFTIREDNGINSVDEFNTELEIVTPLETGTRKATYEIKWRASGFEIEQSRRLSTKPTESVNTDDDIFISATTDANNNTQTEKNAAFSTLSGVFSPSTVYNARISPKRCFLNQAKWLNSSMWYKRNKKNSLGEFLVYKTQFNKNNGNLTSQFSGTEAYPLGDVDKDIVIESSDVQINQAHNGKALVLPEIVTIKGVVLSLSDIDTLQEAYRGLGATPNGYIRTIDNDGNYVEVFPTEITGKPKNNVFTIKGYLKGNFYD